MTDTFRLAGLLRVRGIQERQAAQRLSRATITAEQTAARERHARAALAGAGTEAVDVRSLAALAASRVAGRSALSDMASLAELHAAELGQARRLHQGALREVRGLERLADEHGRRAAADQARHAQAELDEIAARTTGEQQ